MNDWMIKDLEWDDKFKPDRGKVLSSEELEEMENYYRYLDVDGDGVPYRTIPGTNPKGSYFTRGSGHNRFGGYTEDASEYHDVVDRLLVKWETAKTLVPKPAVSFSKNNDIGIISIGSCDDAIREARDIMKKQGQKINYLRVKAFPFTKEVQKFLDAHKTIFVIEQNRDGQLAKLLISETEVDAKKIKSIRLYNGIPIFPKDVVEKIQSDLKAGKAA